MSATAAGIEPPKIDFRPLRRSDFPLLSQWLAEPLVAWWRADDPTLEAIGDEYGDVADGTDRARHSSSPSSAATPGSSSATAGAGPRAAAE